MTVVNKFNVNNKQVTLDADIIENMSANDVPYDSSFQYNKNTVGNKLSKLESEINVFKEDVTDEVTVFKETVTEQVNNYKPIVINGNVTNAQDEEDLTSVDGLLKFKNRSSLNGMGYVILRKNKSFAEQVTLPNTIYEIRYDFDLNGQEITIPEGCLLEFDGGSLNNGTIVLNNTYLDGLPKIFCTVFGTIQNERLDVSFFGCDKSGQTDCSSIIQNILSLNKPLYIPDGTFLITNQIEVPQFFSLYGNGRSSILKCTYQGYAFHYSTQSENKPISLRIDNIQVIGNYPSFYSDISTAEITDKSSFFRTDYYTYECSITNSIFTNLKNAFYIHMAFYAKIHQNSFLSCYDAVTVTEANSSSYTNNNFNFIFHTGLIFKGRGDGVNEECTGINISGNSFQVSGFTGIWILAKIFSHTSIVGNYFEKLRRETIENTNRELIVGDIDGTEQLSYTPTISNCVILANSGLWAPKGIYLHDNTIFNSNKVDAHIMCGTDVTGNNNEGNIEDYNLLYLFRDGYIYGVHYKYGKVKADIANQQRVLHERDICIPANSSYTLTTFNCQAIKLLSYISTISGVTLVIKTIDSTSIYIAGGEEGGQEYGITSSNKVENVWDKNNLPKLITGQADGNPVSVKLLNTSDNNVCVDIDIKYCYY